MTNELKLVTVEIQIPEIVFVESRNCVCSIDTPQLSPDIIAQLFVHGLGQKIGDAASGASGDAALNALGDDVTKKEVKEWTMDPMNKDAIKDLTQTILNDAREKLYADVWTMRRAKRDVDPIETIAIAFADADMQRQLSARNGNAKKLTGLAKADRRAKVLAYIAATVDTVDYMVNAQVEFDRRESEADKASETLDALGL